MKQRGFIQLSFMAWAAISVGGILLLSWTALYVQTQRLDSANLKLARIEQAAANQKRAMELKAEADQRLQKEKDEKRQREHASLSADNKRLRDQLTSRSLLPAVTTPAGVDRACFDRPLLDAALREFTSEVARLFGEGDQTRIDLNLSKEWAQELKRR